MKSHRDLPMLGELREPLLDINRPRRRVEDQLFTSSSSTIDAAYERRPIAVTSNIHPSGFDTIMPKTLAGASTDRLMHHAHPVTSSGDSHHPAEALAGKGVVPST